MSWLDSITDFTDINLSKLQEKEMATHSTIHDWKILWTESLAGYSPWSHKGQIWLSD